MNIRVTALCLVLGVSLFTSVVASAGAITTIYGGDQCQPLDADAAQWTAHVGGVIRNDQSGTTDKIYVDCPIPRHVFKINKKVTVTVNFFDSNDQTADFSGLNCEFVAYDKFNNFETDGGGDGVIYNPPAATQGTPRGNSSFSITLKPLSKDGRYRLLCGLPAITTNSSAIYSYKVVEFP